MKAPRATILLAIFIAMIGLAQGIAISPAKSTFNFESGSDKQITLTIINNEHKEMDVAISFQGPLAKQLSVGQEIIHLTKEEGERKVQCMLAMPSSLDTPGDLKTDIVVMELPAKTSEGRTAVVSATTTVDSAVLVKVPYPETYAEAKLYVSKAEENKSVLFTLPVFNLGNSQIEAWAEITILGQLRESLTTILTDKIRIDQQRDAKFEAEWLANVPSGEYFANVTVHYNDKKIQLSKTFEVGLMLVDVYKIEVTDFQLGQIAKFNLYLKNGWNKDIPNAHAEIAILDQNSQTLTRYKTADFSLPSMQMQKTEAYWDTKEVLAGQYELKLFLYYLDKVFEDSYSMQVKANSIEVNAGPTGAVVGSGSPSQPKLPIYILIILIMAIIGSIMVVIRIKKKRHKNQQQQL